MEIIVRIVCHISDYSSVDYTDDLAHFFVAFLNRFQTPYVRPSTFMLDLYIVLWEEAISGYDRDQLEVLAPDYGPYGRGFEPSLPSTS